jgi:zinc protease
MAWHAGAAPDRQSRVMEVLLSILGNGDSSRLHQRLVEQERAAVQVGTQLDAGFDPGLAWVYAVVPPGFDVAKTEALIDAEIARLAKDGPSAAELTKAQALGTYEVFHGDYRKLFDAPAVYESITAEDVKQAAAQVLRKENRTVGVLESPPKASAAGTAGGAR